MNLFEYLSAHPMWALIYLGTVCVTTRFTLAKLALYYAWSKKPVQDTDYDDIESDDDVKDGPGTVANGAGHPLEKQRSKRTTVCQEGGALPETGKTAQALKRNPVGPHTGSRS